MASFAEYEQALEHITGYELDDLANNLQNVPKKDS